MAILLQLYRRLLCYNKTKTEGDGSIVAVAF